MERYEENPVLDRLRPDCISCLLKKYMASIPEEAPDEKKRQFMQKMMRILADAKAHVSAPVLSRLLDEQLEVSEDPLRLALQYAMVGNYIDFGAVGIVDETYLTALLKDAALNSVDERTFAQLKLELESAEKLVYLTDNCGEIVMDKLLIGQLKALYPQMELTVIVRGGEVLNDATVEDAVQVGLTELVPVIDNGNSIAGTWMDEVSAQARHVMEDADLILAKGQANYETLRGCGMNIYYIFLCKCEMFARMFQVPRFSGMLLKERETGIGI